MPKEVDMGLKAVDRVNMAVHKVGHKEVDVGLKAVEGGHKVGHKKVNGVHKVSKVPKEVLLALNNQWAAWL